MALTQNQLNHLRCDLQELATIEYDEVMNELLDHYATLTEQKMANGMAFDEASKWAWVDLGSGEGLQAIQDDYEKSIKHQVRSRHIEIMKSYFRWPAFVTTALVGILFYLAIPLLPAKYTIVLLILFSCIPGLLLWWGRSRLLDKHTDTRGIVWKYVEASGVFVAQVVPAGLNLTGGLFSDSPTQTFYQLHTSVSVVICLLLLLYTTSFIQLFREQFIYKPNLA